MDKKEVKKISSVNIFNQEKIEVSDCKQVISSTDKEVTAKTDGGFVVISGANMTISKLIPENGELTVTGLISGVRFETKIAKKSFFGKVFK